MALKRGTKQVQERNVCYIPTTFLDKNRAPVVPLSARYRIDDITDDKRQVQDWAIIGGLASSIELTITPEQNRILNDNRSVERRQVTVEATGVDTHTFYQTFEYEIINRAGTT